MRYIAHHVSTGIDDPQWYEEQVSFLLRRLLGHEASLARTVSDMTHMKSWKRRETFMRLARVTDLIHSCYERPLTIEELAEAAHWSRFHMMREFKAVHGISPYEYLQRRRTQTAARLLVLAPICPSQKSPSAPASTCARWCVACVAAADSARAHCACLRRKRHQSQQSASVQNDNECRIAR